jgi:hypothetical protein
MFSENGAGRERKSLFLFEFRGREPVLSLQYLGGKPTYHRGRSL